MQQQNIPTGTLEETFTRGEIREMGEMLILLAVFTHYLSAGLNTDAVYRGN